MFLDFIILMLLLTYSIEQVRSWETNRFSASQEIPRFLWIPNVHCRIYKSPSLVPILNHINAVHAPPFHFPKTHFNIILLSYAWVSFHF